MTLPIAKLLLEILHSDRHKAVVNITCPSPMQTTGEEATRIYVQSQAQYKLASDRVGHCNDAVEVYVRIR